MKRLTFFEGGRWRVRLNGTVYSGFPEIDRLAAYEDIGLEPEEIKNFLKRWCATAERGGFTPPPNTPLTLEELREMDGGGPST